MRRQAVDTLLESALECAGELLADGDIIDKQYESAVASFGGSLIQVGVKPTCALYLNPSSSTIDRKRIVYILLKLIEEQDGIETINKLPAANDNTGNNKEIYQSCMETVIRKTENEQDRFRQQMFNAVTALKLALRTFKLKK